MDCDCGKCTAVPLMTWKREAAVDDEVEVNEVLWRKTIRLVTRSLHFPTVSFTNLQVLLPSQRGLDY
jgi:hypothetical protein